MRHDLLHLVTGLGHSVPGIQLRIETSTAECLLVAHHHRDAHLTPCDFRSIVLTPSLIGVRDIGAVIETVSVIAGVTDQGGGIYRRCHPSATEERWFATTCTLTAIHDVVAACSHDLPTDSIEVVLKPDAELGVTTVAVVAGPEATWTLDDVAARLLAGCLVEEVTWAATIGSHRLR